MQASLPALTQPVTLAPLQAVPPSLGGVPCEPATPRQGHSPPGSASNREREREAAPVTVSAPVSAAVAVGMPGVSGISPSRRGVGSPSGAGGSGGTSEVPLRVARGGRAGGIVRKRNTSPRTVARRVGGGSHLGGTGTTTSGATGAGPGSGSGGTGSADAVLPRGSVVKITGNNRTKRELLNRQGLVLSAQTLGGWHEVALNDGATVRVQRNALTLLDAPSAATVAMLPPAAPQPQSRTSDSVAAGIARLDDAALRRYKRHHRLPIPDSAGRAELETAVRRHFARTKVNEQEVIRGFVRQLHK